MSQTESSKKSVSALNFQPPLPSVSKFIWVICIGLLVLLAWAWFFELEEVSTGSGKVIPSSKEQSIQSLEGGILTKLYVSEGEIVKQGQVLAQLDPTRFASNVGESESLLIASKATAARLRAEVNATPLVFPEDVLKIPKLVSEETALYQSRRSNLNDSVSGLSQALVLVEQELAMTEPLVAKGAASEVEVLRLKREANDLRNQMNDIRNQYYVKAREELAKANIDIETQAQVIKGKTDTLQRTVFKSPVRGIVKEIDVMTIGGVIPQNGKLMTIVPLDEQLLIEARISPRDIAFIRPDQEALVKVTAYDYSIYGGLHGKVTVISPDTLRDEVKQDQFYYRAYIRTDSDKLINKQGKQFNITPGMVAVVDIKTGHKTVLDYLIKPFNKAKEALRER
ncbi:MULTISPECIES: HlyD family efflux transporter periplasmic adaptor subunit [Acinetobacter]|jgi:adhesin transport system membrane fusion protein|uniref:HlyD family efflux transporter periplasmic adaptor subunit n=1 Tax=Acinetobacter johnsonii TaxID=40214 RepID=A0AAJ6IC99_ACIJO|nr:MULTISPECIES: HlyD family efflux transporter periplasmic adaptor subunit [Acinetobacter]ALV73208.1 secretion protein HlyD [Acinetobacter johnsonii XBB1]MBK5648681.1 HlyD family efflux transporter periplasmic adaptor subunit [Acinetobacter sp.]MBO7706306.1 HlyD family efflux transporter periplasmic adaptor subunit [Acinetobacter sp.]MCV2452914.1 HlyD family efflux transporter periplasmic adaptor subunit [Acinetobacter johnsonii]MDH1533960.1 HlyD family efflux transporter periplasmic adaptor 